MSRLGIAGDAGLRASDDAMLRPPAGSGAAAGFDEAVAEIASALERRDDAPTTLPEGEAARGDMACLATPEPRGAVVPIAAQLGAAALLMASPMPFMAGSPDEECAQPQASPSGGRAAGIPLASAKAPADGADRTLPDAADDPSVGFPAALMPGMAEEERLQALATLPDEPPVAGRSPPSPVSRLPGLDPDSFGSADVDPSAGSIPPTATTAAVADRSGALRLRAVLTARETHFAPVAGPSVPPLPAPARSAPAVAAAAAWATSPVPAGVLPVAAGLVPAGEVEVPEDPTMPVAVARPARRAPSERGAPAQPAPSPEFHREAVPGQTRPDGDIARGGPAPDRSLEAAARLAPVDPAPAEGALAPSQGLPAGEVRRLATAIGQSAASLAAPDGSARSAPSAFEAGGPVRVLALELNPDNLGHVTVRLRLDGARLSLRIAASRPETARMIENDGDALLRLLGAEGYDADLVALSPTPEPRVAALAANPDGGAASQASGDGQAMNRRSFDEQRGRGSRDDDRKSHSKDSFDEDRTSPLGRPVYV